MSKALELVESQIERVIKDLLDLDYPIAQSSGNVSIGLTKLRDLSDTLKANAAKAVFAPKVTDLEIKVHDLVVSKGEKIANVAGMYGISKTTVRRYLDKVTEVRCIIGNS